MAAASRSVTTCDYRCKRRAESFSRGDRFTDPRVDRGRAGWTRVAPGRSSTARASRAAAARAGPTISTDRLIDSSSHPHRRRPKDAARVRLTPARSPRRRPTRRATPWVRPRDRNEQSTHAASSASSRRSRGTVARVAGLASDRLHAALALWRGSALPMSPMRSWRWSPSASTSSARLSRGTQRSRLALGRHDALVPELERLVEEEPLRERFWGQLVTALYRCQRQADALSAYRRAARSCPRSSVSSRARSCESSAPSSPRTPTAPVSHRHNLPAPLTSFVGREQELSELDLAARAPPRHADRDGGRGQDAVGARGGNGQSAPDRRLWLVEIAALADDALVPVIRRSRVGVAERPDVFALEGLLDHLLAEELLLVVDNCEHLATPCGELALEVLTRVPPCSRARNEPCSARCPRRVRLLVEPLPTPSPDVPSHSRTVRSRAPVPRS